MTGTSPTGKLVGLQQESPPSSPNSSDPDQSNLLPRVITAGGPTGLFTIIFYGSKITQGEMYPDEVLKFLL